ncbi:MAG: hypothetical protein WBO55_10395 [Rhizobiaceae bacterium]
MIDAKPVVPKGTRKAHELKPQMVTVIDGRHCVVADVRILVGGKEVLVTALSDGVIITKTVPVDHEFTVYLTKRF